MAELNNSKRIIRDIVPKIKDTVPKSRKTVPKKIAEKDFFQKLSESKKKNEKKDDDFAGNFKKNKGGKTRGGKVVLLIIAIFIAGGVFYYFQPAVSAVVKIIPVSKTVSVSAFVKASETNGEIPLFIISGKTEKQDTVAASGVENQEKKAAGTIMIYNSFSANPQVLIKSTRLETSDGKIYRINNTLTVPGFKKNKGKQIPGSAEALVTADKPGKEYNIGLSDFKFSGFRGTAKYDKIYARSKTVFQGGFLGEVPKADENSLKEIDAKLKDSLQKEILTSISSELNQEKILSDGGYDINFSSESSLLGDNSNEAVVREKAEYFAGVLKKSDITDFLVKKYLAGTDFGNGSYIKNFENLTIKALKKDFANKEITLKIEGDAKFMKYINADRLKEELISVEDKKQVFKSHPEIDEAQVILNPAWKKTFPKDKSKITIEIN